MRRKLAANFILSREGQEMLPKAGRLPVRADVHAEPARTPSTRLESQEGHH